jgi:pimeloyl-ACP methyl ester carboxylesterase
MNPTARSFVVEKPVRVTLNALHWGTPSDMPIVLLHGGGGNAHWWDHIAAPLARDHYVVALDFRGHGDSSYPESLTVGGFNLDLEALCVELGSEAVTLVGHSMGAHVALDHASRHPLTRAMVLVDLSRGGSKRSSRVARLALTLRRAYRSRASAVERFRFVPNADHVSEALREAVADKSIREEPDGRFGFKFDPRWFGVTPRPRPDPSQVQCPTLLIRGAESSLLSPEGAEAFSNEIPNAELLEIKSAGHHVPFDQPDALIEALREFVSRTSN